MRINNIYKAFTEMTGYELLICWLITMGYKQKEIAEMLHAKYNTVKGILFRLRKKYKK